jgi:hypothetical protein
MLRKIKGVYQHLKHEQVNEAKVWTRELALYGGLASTVFCASSTYLDTSRVGPCIGRQKPFTEDPASEGSNILVWFGSLRVLPSP